MPSKLRLAFACAALLLCALLPASASAERAPRELLVAHTDGRLTVESPSGGPTIIAVELPCG